MPELTDELRARLKGYRYIHFPDHDGIYVAVPVHRLELLGALAITLDGLGTRPDTITTLPTDMDALQHFYAECVLQWQRQLQGIPDPRLIEPNRVVGPRHQVL